ncbi:MAG TPA: hypothetical protein O0X27_06265 [Methanocorpusculum sp.]|nr:hypothetical protein [Methanocorpusculum sp.]
MRSSGSFVLSLVVGAAEPLVRVFVRAVRAAVSFVPAHAFGVESAVSHLPGSQSVHGVRGAIPSFPSLPFGSTVQMIFVAPLFIVCGSAICAQFPQQVILHVRQSGILNVS